MGNTRRFNPSRRQAVRSLKQRNKDLRSEIGYLEGLVMVTEAKLAASRMERPADLDEWVANALIDGDMSPEEVAEWEAMSPGEQQEFLDQLGQRINESIAAADQPPS